jgi:hypothetical protein
MGFPVHDALVAIRDVSCTIIGLELVLVLAVAAKPII